MGHPIRRAICLISLSLAVTALPGCNVLQNFLPSSNIFNPTARLQITAQPALINARITYSGGRYAFVNDALTFQIAAYPGDVIPGVQLTDYAIRYLDNTGNEIGGLLIPRSTLATSAYVGRGASVILPVPGVSQAVDQYGVLNGFVNSGSPANPIMSLSTTPWSQAITGQVTFYGHDDNQNAITAVGSYTVNFLTVVQ